MNKPRTVLFVCTGNCVRSQMAEAIMKHLAGDCFVVWSAGSHPAGFVHDLVELTLKELEVTPVADAESQSWDEFEDRDPDLVITLCDFADGFCPEWITRGLKVHWPIPDPSIYDGTDDERMRYSASVARRMMNKIDQLVQIDYENLTDEQVREKLDYLGQI